MQIEGVAHGPVRIDQSSGPRGPKDCILLQSGGGGRGHPKPRAFNFCPLSRYRYRYKDKSGKICVCKTHKEVQASITKEHVKNMQYVKLSK